MSKEDSNKLPWNLLPWAALRPVVVVLAFGAGKYGADNWKTVPQARARFHAAAIRHITAWALDEGPDPDTGENHLAHAICCAR